MSCWKFWKKSKVVAEETVEPEVYEIKYSYPVIDPFSDEVVPLYIEPEVTKVTTKPLDLMKVKFERSPNQSNRKDKVRGIVLHHTGPGSFNGIVNWLTNPQAQASAHYVSGKNAELKQLVNTTKSAWHAGVSKGFLDGKVRENLNHSTIGIEICNVGILQKGEDGKFYYEQGRNLKVWTGAKPIKASIQYQKSGKHLIGYSVPYPEKQLNKLVALCKALIEKYPEIGPEDFLTHYDIGQPEGRKNDPFGLDVQAILGRIFDK